MSTMAVRVPVRAGVAVVGYAACAVGTWRLPFDELSPEAPRSELVRGVEAWRAAGCQACHSIYGLGGHTGPDLTNVISRNGPEYVRAMMRAGPRGMPSYAGRGDDEIEAIIEYLSRLDASGTYPAHGWMGPREPDR